MEKNIRMDSHKLIYHPDVVARWMKGEDIYPIEMKSLPVVPAITGVYSVRWIILGIRLIFWIKKLFYAIYRI